MDQATRDYITRTIDEEIIGEHAITGNILEIGSLDVNGAARGMFSKSKEYVGVDIDDGPGVDINGHLLDVDFKDKKFDLILSLNCFEHDIAWRETFCAALNLLKNNGYMLIFVPTQVSTATYWRFPKLLGEQERNSEEHYASLIDKNKIDPVNAFFNNSWPDSPERTINSYFSETRHVPLESREFRKTDLFLKTPNTPLPFEFSKPIMPNPGETTHYAISSNLVLSHNIHYTSENGYYQNVSLGHILECLYTKEDYHKFLVKDCICSFSQGLQLGLVVQKKGDLCD
tara:strand:- start:39817 stop:40674 length:858 start_codon:yes stop_codon:yes gene_type:complete